MHITKLAAAVTVGAASLALMSPAAADPGSNCPRGFTLGDLSDLGDDYTGIADQVNGDTKICFKLNPNSGTGSFMDNVVRPNLFP